MKEKTAAPDIQLVQLPSGSAVSVFVLPFLRIFIKGTIKLQLRP